MTIGWMVLLGGLAMVFVGALGSIADENNATAWSLFMYTGLAIEWMGIAIP